jgi:hypothetical protein
MPDDISGLRKSPFSDEIENIEKLLANGSRAFLIGAGCSKCAGLPLTSELKDLVLARLSEDARETLRAVIDGFKGAKNSTIEEYMSELIDLMAIAKRRVECGAEEQCIALAKKEYTEKQLATVVKDVKAAIVDCVKVPSAISTHRRFIRTIHYRLQAGKRSGSQPAEYLVLNYDTLVEDALALERVPYADGIFGGATGWWNIASLSPDNQQTRVIKLHGSIDWVLLKEEVLPRRIRDGLTVGEIDPSEGAVIWPATTKYRETERDPFAQLAKIMRVMLRPAPNLFTVLTVCGYRFADTHINLELYRALKESEQRLTLLVFTDMDQPEGVLKVWHEDPDLRKQVRIYAKRGFFHTADSPSEEELPWWKFEVLTRLLEGER